MTEKELLAELCRRAGKKNLYFDWSVGIGRSGPKIETKGGSEIFDIHETIPGSRISNHGGTDDTMVIMFDDVAAGIIRKLLPMEEFKKSGKWYRAKEVLDQYENH